MEHMANWDEHTSTHNASSCPEKPFGSYSSVVYPIVD